MGKAGIQRSPSLAMEAHLVTPLGAGVRGAPRETRARLRCRRVGVEFEQRWEQKFNDFGTKLDSKLGI